MSNDEGILWQLVILSLIIKPRDILSISLQINKQLTPNPEGNEMSKDQITVVKMSADKMPVNKLSVEKLSEICLSAKCL